VKVQFFCKPPGVRELKGCTVILLNAGTTFAILYLYSSNNTGTSMVRRTKRAELCFVWEIARGAFVVKRLPYGTPPPFRTQGLCTRTSTVRYGPSAVSWQGFFFLFFFSFSSSLGCPIID